MSWWKYTNHLSDKHCFSLCFSFIPFYSFAFFACNSINRKKLRQELIPFYVKIPGQASCRQVWHCSHSLSLGSALTKSPSQLPRLLFKWLEIIVFFHVSKNNVVGKFWEVSREVPLPRKRKKQKWGPLEKQLQFLPLLVTWEQKDIYWELGIFKTFYEALRWRGSSPYLPNAVCDDYN